MVAPTILPDPTQLHLLGFAAEPTRITACVVATAGTAACPLCGRLAARVHSRYVRHASDLPWHGVALRLELHVQRFFCDTPACPRQIFTERLPGLLAPYARRTERLQAWFTAVGFAAGGEAGARLLQALGLAASPDTVLRHIRRTVLPQLATPRVLGVDDWSSRRGQTYGTILVDLERHAPVDLLPDRSAATLATWLEQHPGVEIVSRDRGGSYADGARQGAPHAVQVADRWHVLKNLMEALERVVSQEQRTVREAAQAVVAARPSEAAPPASSGNLPTGTPDPPPSSPASPPRRTRHEQRQTERRARRLARYEAVQRLQGQSLPLAQIARELNLDRGTVRRFVRAASFPEQASRRGRPSLLAPFTVYLRERWNAGEQNGQHLLAELRAQGYPGSSTILYTLLAQWRGRPYARHSGQAHRTTRVGQCSPRQIAWLLMKADEERSSEEQIYVRELLQRSIAVAHAQQLVTAFFTLVRTRQAIALEPWLQAAEASGIRDLVGFAQGIRRDRKAVDAGLTLDWSQGQTEGHVNRLKLLKRAMYGRAKLDLLRQRVLHHHVS